MQHPHYKNTKPHHNRRRPANPPARFAFRQKESKPDTANNQKGAGAQQKHPQPMWRCYLHSGEKTHGDRSKRYMKSNQTNYQVAAAVEHVKPKSRNICTLILLRQVERKAPQKTYQPGPPKSCRYNSKCASLVQPHHRRF